MAFTASALILGGALGWFFSHHPFLVNRMEAVSATDPNVTSRFALWRAARHAFYAHPVFGIGYGQFPGYGAREEGLGQLAAVSHQTYLSAAAELGILGLFALLWLLLSVMRDAWRASARTGLAWPSSVRNTLPVAASRNTTRPSPPPLRSCLPSAANATANTPSPP